jgi:hypothetical protein
MRTFNLIIVLAFSVGCSEAGPSPSNEAGGGRNTKADQQTSERQKEWRCTGTARWQQADHAVAVYVFEGRATGEVLLEAYEVVTNANDPSQSDERELVAVEADPISDLQRAEEVYQGVDRSEPFIVTINDDDRSSLAAFDFEDRSGSQPVRYSAIAPQTCMPLRRTAAPPL